MNLLYLNHVSCSLLAEISTHNVEVRTELCSGDDVHCESSNHDNEVTEQHIVVDSNASRSGRDRLSTEETRQNESRRNADVDLENSSNEMYSVSSSHETRPTEPGARKQRGRGRS